MRWLLQLLGIIEPGPAHNHSEGDWQSDCPAVRCVAITEDYQAYIDAQGPTMNPHQSKDGLWR